MKIREATHLDLLALSVLAEDYAAEVDGYGGLAYAPEKALEMAYNTICMEGGVILLVSDETGIHGLLWAVCYPSMPWSDTVIASDLMFYVKPSHRGRLGGYRLLKAYRAWAEGQGAEVINLSVASGIEQDRTVRLFERLGFQSIATQSRVIL